MHPERSTADMSAQNMKGLRIRRLLGFIVFILILFDAHL
jgi:hypothetical protein